MFNKQALNPLVMPVMFADPKGAIRKAKGTKMRLKGAGNIGVPGVKSASVDERARALLVKESMDKEALLGWVRKIPGRLAKVPGRVGDFARKHPILAGGGLIAGTAGALALGDYVADEARTVGRARGFRGMMNAYGPELSHIAEYDAEGRVPADRIRQAYNALYAVAPDIAKDPTLAAAQMSPMIRMMGDTAARLDPEGTRGLAMLESLSQFAEPSSIQGRVPKRKNLSDYVATATGTVTGLGKAHSMLADPAAISEQQQLGRQRATRDADNMAFESERAQELAYRQAMGRETADAENAPAALHRDHERAFSQAQGREKFESSNEQALLDRARRMAEAQDEGRRLGRQGLGP